MRQSMKPIISIGPFTFYFFGVMIAIGILIGFFLFIKETRKRGLNEKLLVDGVFYSLIGGIIGARLIYILFYNPSYYISNPLEVLYIHQGGLSIHGGILGGILVGYFFMRRHKLPIFQVLDIAAPSIILAQGIGRVGCDVFGGPISNDIPWGIEFQGEYLHPAQAYEFILDYLLFGYLYIKNKKASYTGQVFIHYLIGFLIIRGIVEFSRINPMVFGPFSVSHLMSFVGIIFGIILANYLKKRSEIIQPLPINKNEIVKTVITVAVLIITSLVIYYGVHS